MSKQLLLCHCGDAIPANTPRYPCKNISKGGRGRSDSLVKCQSVKHKGSPGTAWNYLTNARKRGEDYMKGVRSRVKAKSGNR